MELKELLESPRKVSEAFNCRGTKTAYRSGIDTADTARRVHEQRRKSAQACGIWLPVVASLLLLPLWVEDLTGLYTD